MCRLWISVKILEVAIGWLFETKSYSVHVPAAFKYKKIYIFRYNFWLNCLYVLRC